MATPRLAQATVGYNSAFLTQAGGMTADGGAPLDEADFNSVFPIPSGNKTTYEIRRTYDDTESCDGEGLADRRLVSEIGFITFRMPYTPETGHGLISLARGGGSAVPTGTGPYAHTSGKAPYGDYALTPTSLAFQWAETDEPAQILPDAVLNRAELIFNKNGKVEIEVEWRFNGATIEASEGFSLPACSNVTPVYTQDCTISIGGIDRTSVFEDGSFVFNNNVIDDPAEAITGTGTTPTNFERDDKRTEQFRYTFYVKPSHALVADAAVAADRAVVVRVGTSTRNTTITAPHVIQGLDGTGARYDGRKRAHKAALIGDVKSVAGVTTTVVSTIPVSGQYLLPNG